MVTIEDSMNIVLMADNEDPSDMAEKLKDFNNHLEDIDPSIKKLPQQMISMFPNKLPKSLYLAFNEGIRNKKMKDLTFESMVDKATHTSGQGVGDRKPKFNGECRIPW